MVSYLQIERLTKSFGDRMLFEDVTFGVYEGDKIGIVARNGDGKTTFLNILTGKEDYDSGNVVYRNGLRVGYLEQLPPMPEGMTALEYATPAPRPESDDHWNGADLARQMLTQFRISDPDMPLEHLSGGQAKRVALAKVLLTEPDMLILDEPTNHLDMRTKDILKQAIKDFNGTVIVVSHDREFLDGLVEKVYEFGGGKVRECLGGIYEFLEKKKISSLQELELSKSPGGGDRLVEKTPKSPSGNAPVTDRSSEEQQKNAPTLSYAEQRERDKMLKRAAKKVQEAEAAVAKAEEDIAQIEQRIANGEADGDIFELHQAKTRALETAMSLWELAEQEHSDLKARFGKQ